MKILLLNPPYLPRFSRQSRSPCVTKSGTLYMPYFLSYMVGVLEKEGFDVTLLDAVAKNMSREQTVEFAKSQNPDLVVIDTSTPSIFNDAAVATAIKEAVPHAHINLVGTHPTALPHETIALGKIDSVCRGEYDYTVRDLAHAIEAGKKLDTVAGLSFKEGKKIIDNKPRARIENLDELPFVSQVYKKHLNIRDYFYASLTFPQITILSARGCPYNCSFCNSPFKASYRPRSIENVVEELEYIQKEMPEVKEIMFEDETFPAVKKRTLELCELMKKRGIKIKWSCNARVNTDIETLDAMKSAGCRLMCVGFESPNARVLESIHKRTTRDMQLEFMRNARNAGLLVNGCFVLGLDSDTRESIKETVEFAKELNPDTAQFYPLMVYPGTEDYKRAKEKGYLTTDDYSKWLTPEGLHNCVVDRPGLNGADLVRLCDEARRQFYLRPKYIGSKLAQGIKNPSEMMRILKAGATFFRHLK
ncbi:Ribosomal protein S12 methylthiotransferase RimO [uncultured archaeon]|nr:Ribosomal protein S12 methylthiotransferase RimO [uncultured archaeon]